MVVGSWSYQFSKWICVILSRVWTFQGLFIYKKWDDTKCIKVAPNLLEEEDMLGN